MNGFPSPKTAAPTPTPAEGSGVLMQTLQRLGSSVLIFGAVFLVVAIALTFVVSPDRFPVKVGENTVRLSELEEEEERLKQKYAELTDARQKLLQAGEAPVLRQVAALRERIVPVGSVLLGIERVRSGFRIGETDPVSLPVVRVDAREKKITLGGEVQDSGGRSMQILASFVDGLRALPSVASVSEPEYQTMNTENGTSSPFTITVTLL